MNFNDFKRLIRPITNKIFLLLGRAVLKAVENSDSNFSQSTQKLQVLALSDEIISDIERFQEYGFETYPHDEAEVFIGFLNGNRDYGVALVVHDERYRPTDLVEGEVALYTDEDSGTDDFRIHLKRNRIFDIKGDKVEETIDTSKEIIVPSETHTNATEHIIDSPEVSLGGDSFAALRTLIDSRFITLFNDHTHAQGNDSDGNSQVETEKPTVPASEANQATAKVKGI